MTITNRRRNRIVALAYNAVLQINMNMNVTQSMLHKFHARLFTQL